MKVLHVYKTYLTESFGGIEQLLAQLANGLKKFGIESRILCLSRQPIPPVIVDQGTEIFRYKQLIDIASTSFSLTAIGGFRKLAQWADIIHYQYPWPFGDVLHFLGQHHKPTVVTYQSDIIRQQRLLKLYRPLQKLFLNRVDRIVATSPNYMDSSTVLKSYHAKTTAIPLGLNQAYYPASSHDILQQWRLRLPAKFLLFIGVLRYYKGLLTLLDACHHTSTPIVIVGDGPLEKTLATRVAAEHLKTVTLLGKVADTDKIALLNLCSGVILPSHLRSEAFGLALVEGAMFKKPLISCEIGTATSFINIDQQTGFVVPPNNPQALAQAMQTLVDQPNLASTMGECAYQRYQQYFTADKMCEQYQALYRSLIKIL